MSLRVGDKIFEPQGFVVVLEPVDRQEIEDLAEQLKTKAKGFGLEEKGVFEEPVLVRVVAAGPGLQFPEGFVENHIRDGDIVVGTMTRIKWAKDFNDPTTSWLIGGKKYITGDARDLSGITPNALFIIKEE